MHAANDHDSAAIGSWRLLTLHGLWLLRLSSLYTLLVSTCCKRLDTHIAMLVCDLRPPNQCN